MLRHHRMAGINSFLILSPPPRCLCGSSPLCPCSSPLVPPYHFFLGGVGEFPFPLIVQINSTLHQPVSHTNLLTSFRNTLFLFLRFFCSFGFHPPFPHKHTFSHHRQYPLHVHCQVSSPDFPRTLVTRAKLYGGFFEV